MTGRWTAFLDRDGTINEPPSAGSYVIIPDQLRLLPGACAAIRRLNRAGWRTVVVTNQRGIARGMMSEDDLRLVHDRLLELLADCGATIDRIYHCPHEAGSCDCRKPKTGLLKRACSEDSEISFDRAILIGDSGADIEAGRAAGIRTVGIGALPGASHQAEDLPSAVDWAMSEGVPRQLKHRNAG
jgi:D-glycero-D-manno-heptose 1,7-bisphosphate phosphatase